MFGALLVGRPVRELLEDTLVAWVADHGESFAEHPGYGPRLVFEENLHVPLVLINSRLFLSRIDSDRLGSHVDLVPTLLDVLGRPPEARHRGQSLVGETYEARIHAVDGEVGLLYRDKGGKKGGKPSKKKRGDVLDLAVGPKGGTLRVMLPAPGACSIKFVVE